MDVIKNEYNLSPNRIREFRLHYGMKLEDLADRVGISSSALSYIERGDRLPNVIIALDIAEVFGTTIERLWRRETTHESRRKNIGIIENPQS